MNLNDECAAGLTGEIGGAIRRVGLSACLFVMTACELPARAENWPQWRGPKNDGVSADATLALEWGRERNVAWRLALPGPAGSTPAVWADRIFLTSADGADLVLVCASTDGKELWRRKVATGNRAVGMGAAEGNLASPSPSTDGEHVWVFFGTGDLACFDFDGNERWKFNLQQRYGAFDIQFGMHSTPVLHEDRLFLQIIHGPMRGDAEPAYVFAVDKATGKELWKKDRKTGAMAECKHSYASPILCDDGRTQFLLTHGADYVVAYRPSDGAELWRHGGMNPPDDGAAGAPPAPSGSGGLIARFDTNKDGKVTRLEIPEGPTRRTFDRLVEEHKLDPAKTYTIDELRKATGLADPAAAQARRPQTANYHSTLRFVATPVAVPGLIVVPTAKRGPVLALRPGLSGDATKSADAMIWKLPRGTPDVPSPLVHDGLVYLAAEDGVLTCIDAKTGESIYRERLHSARHRSSPICAAGHVFVPAFDGRVSVVKVGRDFKLVAQNDLGETLTASPVVSNGTLYLRTFDALWAIRQK